MWCIVLYILSLRLTLPSPPTDKQAIIRDIRISDENKKEKS